MCKAASALLHFGAYLSQHHADMIPFTGVPAADALLNNIDSYPHLFLLGVVADRQMKAERAWLLPWYATQKFGSNTFEVLRRVDKAQWHKLLLGPPSLHRFPAAIADAACEALAKVEKEYSSNASLIWSDKPSSALVVSRLLAFKGIGPKLATMAVNILATQFGVPLSDHYSVDISADVHVRRVLGRLKLVPPHATIEQVVYVARAINPQFPGALDRPAFEIGKRWCRAKSPLCSHCFIAKECPSSER